MTIFGEDGEGVLSFRFFSTLTGLRLTHTTSHFGDKVALLEAFYLTFLDDLLHAPVISADIRGIFLWLPYANIFRTGPPVFANLPLGVTLITNRSI